MAAYAALVSLLNNIHAVTKHPQLSTSFDNKYIHPLVEKTNILLEFIEGNTYGGGSKEVQDLERKIASAAHAAEDLIESRIVDRIDEESTRCPSLLTFLLKCVGCDDMEQTNLRRIIDDMDSISEEANEFKEKSRLQEEQQPTHVAEPLRDGGESGMVGLDAELIQLLDELTGYQSNRRIISIVGMGGTAKTTLAKNVYENKLIKEKYQFRAWATISQQSNAKEVLSELFSCLGEPGGETLDDLGVQLHKTLFGRRYLIIIDDIWSVTAWNELKHFFPHNNNGTRILLTTRLTNVAKDWGSSLFVMKSIPK